MSTEIYTSPLLDDANLEAYYRFESGALTTDSSGNSKTLTETGSPTEETGKFGGAIGVSGDWVNYVDTTDVLGIAGGSFCASGWFKFDSLPTSSYDYILFRWGDASIYLGDTLLYEYNGGTYRLNFRHSRWGYVHENNRYETTLNTGQWYHLVLIRNSNGTVYQGYLDNSLIIDTTYISGNGTTGGSTGFDIGRMNGDIDDVAVFSRVLTTSEIEAIYKDFIMLVSVGTFTLTGINAILTSQINMITSVGSFILTGIDVILSKGFVLIASVGTFTLTGINIIMNHTRNFAVSVGVFTLTGIDITFSHVVKAIKFMGKIKGVSIFGKIKSVIIKGKIK